MAQKVFSKDYLVDELDLPYSALFDEIVDQGRWTIYHRCVFQDRDGIFYETTYGEGATESQFERPWEYDDNVTCDEVELKEVMVKKWVKKGV